MKSQNQEQFTEQLEKIAELAFEDAIKEEPESLKDFYRAEKFPEFLSAFMQGALVGERVSRRTFVVHKGTWN